MGLKKIDKLIVSSFIGPYVLSFFIAEFTLVMQFMWRYIDDILGKGISTFDIVTLLWYHCIQLIPLALPISILLASVMVYGDLAEKYELSSMKSAGVSLLRLMRPGIIIALFTFGLSIFASNYLKPVATLQFYKLFDAIKRQKSSLFIEEKVFNDDFNSFVIRVDKKYPNDRDMKDISLYDQTVYDPNQMNLIKADSANMYTEENGKYFVMQLHNGTIYQEEARKRSANGKMSYPFVRTEFAKYKKVLDMSEFAFDEGIFDMGRSKDDMLNTFQLIEEIDSLNKTKISYLRSMPYDYTGITKAKYMPDSLKIFIAEQANLNAKPIDSTLLNRKLKNIPKKVLEDARAAIALTSSPDENFVNGTGIKQKQLTDLSKYNFFYETLDSISLINVLYRGITYASNRYDNALTVSSNINENHRTKEAFMMKLNQHFSNALICLIFLFIGAPLGSIIRKGGYGYPLLIAILFYMVFIISSIMGSKLLKSGTLDSFTSAWIGCIIMLPFAVFFTIHALNDSKFEGIGNFISKVKVYFEKLKR